VRGEANRLQQVIWNLLSNAVKFTPARGAVVITVRRANHHVNIEVADTGVGIRRDVLPFIFDRFRQADSSTTRSHGGLGLGLAIARYIVELHGGTLRAESPGEGQGATFIVELPMTIEQKKDAAAARPEPSETVAGWAPVLQGCTVLVVEDNDDARELVSAVLTSSGAIVNAVGTSQEAIDAFLQAAPDAVIADIGLPGEDGYELLRRIRLLDHARARSVPVIALTAYARAEDRERALAAGFARHVVKPVDPAFLVRIVASLL
jgi:CheY-like chemotaxis protein